MIIESQERCYNIYPITKKSENNSIFNNEYLNLQTEIRKSENSGNITEDMVSYPIVYNNATLENANEKIMDKQNDEMTDEEITYELNKEIYDGEKLSERGIEFNSKEFFEYLEKSKKGDPVPYDAPPKIRKILKDTLDKLRNENGIVWFYTLKAFGRGLKDKDTKDPNSYLDICDNTIDKNKNNIKSLVMSGLANNPLFSDSMKLYKGLVNVFSKIKNDINSYLIKED